jgi:deoxyribodipyrimidine photo-lyase
VPASGLYRGGEARALSTLEVFIDDRLEEYDERRNDPSLNATSDMSPYLRFGNISPLRVVSEAMESGAPKPDIDAFVEQAFVRRELAVNFTFYNSRYRSLASLPGWARDTLQSHKADQRPRLFTLKELEEGRTGEKLWDVSQAEMVKTGKMAGYMRLLWAKMVLRWTKTPEEALKVLLYLNDKYELDGRSPNGYAGIMWCFGKHDRAFRERPVYGKLRYMSVDGARRKFSVKAYLSKVNIGPALTIY